MEYLRTTVKNQEKVFLSGGKYSGAVSTGTGTGTGDDTIYLGSSDASQSKVDISGLTHLESEFSYALLFILSDIE
ncbi:hypothetical protein [Escherichia coli]|uniref:hypothetical protein n=1 Tax=Escherichia coli TaxID=562 RepID=UPI00209B58AA|nr:hypothetical protein [Escherichia coli]MCO8132737.1 hypothetical protein [Escherichia coli]